MKKLLLILFIPVLSFGQNLCEGVTVELNSMNDSTLNIVISTVNSPDFWCSYCGLVLRDNNNNIVAIENPYNGGSFYGLAGGYEELRTLEIINSIEFPFEGEIHAMHGLMPNVLVDENFDVDPLNPIDMVDGDIPFTMCSWEFDLSFGQTSATEDCNSIPNIGPCFASIVTYYFNQNTAQCEESYWGGCGGLVAFWTLEGCQNNCENNSFIQELITSKLLIKKIDFLGRETTKNQGLQLQIYDDGTVEKKYLIK